MDGLKNKVSKIIFTVLLLGFAFLLFSNSGQNEEREQSQTENNIVTKINPVGRITLTKINNQPLMPLQFKAAVNWRDPFADPHKTLVKEETAKNLALNNKLNQATAGADMPSLAGIISSASRKLAILQYGGNSRPYKEGDLVGRYKVLKIEEKTVVLETGANTLTIRMPGS
jgi:Tfp pilus assembly protein PilP